MRIGLGAAVVLAACTGTAHAFGMDDVEDAASRVASHAKRSTSSRSSRVSRRKFWAAIEKACEQARCFIVERIEPSQLNIVQIVMCRYGMYEIHMVMTRHDTSRR